MKFAVVDGNVKRLGQTSRANAGIATVQWSQSAERSESGIGRIGGHVTATAGRNLKQNGIALGRTAFPKTGRRLATCQKMAKSTGPT
jgi:hypothetical protein